MEPCEGGFHRVVSLKTIPVGSDEVLAAVPGAAPVLLSRFTAECLARCTSFRSLPEHARAIGAELGLGGEDCGEILRELEGAAGAGFLRSFASIAGEGEGGAPAAPDRAATVESFGIVSANRPASACRALESYTDNARRHGRAPEWVLHDDSADPAMRAEYRAMIASLAAERGVPILYGGEEEKRDFAQALAGEGLPPETVEFCLFGLPGFGARYGANSNARLLDLAGRVGLSADDDTLCDVGALAETEPGLEFASGDPTACRYFRSPPEARAALVHRDEDYLGLHEAWLGRSFRGCAAAFGPLAPSDLDRAEDRLVSSLAAGTGRVAVTQAGIAGDSGMGSTFCYLSAEGESRERLFADEDSYAAFMESRALVRMVERPTVADCPAYMNYSVGYDGRMLLPPFLPVMRNCDGLFGLLLPLVIPDAAFGLIPRTVGHEPPEQRRSDAASRLGVATGIGVADSLAQLARAFPGNCIARDDAAERTRALGRFYRGLGMLPAAELEELLVQVYLREKARLLASMETLLADRRPAPAAWGEELRACSEALRRAIPDRGNAIPGDLRAATPGRRLEAFAFLLRRYGELLELWPDLERAARELRGRGIRLVRPL